MMCQVLEVARSSFYDFMNRSESNSRDTIYLEKLKTYVKAVFKESRGTYGARRIKPALASEYDIHISRKSTAKVMKMCGVVAKSRRVRKRTTIASSSGRYQKDLLGRDFSASIPGEKLVGDITYIRTTSGFSYLATVIDCYSKAVVGWAIDTNMKAQLVCDAISMAARRVPIKVGETIFHCDRGSQYTSKLFQDTLEKLGIRLSQGRTGTCFDNSMAESFFSHFKTEAIYPYPITSTEMTRIRVVDYIESFYNPKRLHSALGYKSPLQVQNEYYENQRTGVA